MVVAIAMKFDIHYNNIYLCLIFLGCNVVECTLVMDLLNNLAQNGVRCLVMISEPNAEADHFTDSTNVSNISITNFNTNANLPGLSSTGKDCLNYLLIFNNVDTSLQFLNKYYESSCFSSTSVMDIFLTNFRSVRHLDIIEDSYYLRRNHSSYIHVLKDDAGHEEVKSLFLSDFFSKVLNAVALTRSKSRSDSFLMWTKSPCDTKAPKLTNVWTKFSGFRKDLIYFIDFL